MIRHYLRTPALLLLLVSSITGSPLDAQRPPASHTMHGFLREAETGEPIVFGYVVIDDRVRTVSDRNGYFSALRLTPGDHRLRVRILGYAPVDTVVGTSAVPLEIRLRGAPVEIAGLTATAVHAGERPREAADVSVQTITPAQVRRVPAALETDLFRALQALPGVIAPSAFSSQLLVRGGAADENLFLLDGYPVLHPYHLTGAFSAFHLDAVQDAEFWTGAPPARYGGKLSSVLDVKLREGNREHRTGTASLGLVSSAAVAEGPHARGAWFVGGRTTYLDLITRAVGKEVPYRFFDLYGKSYADLGPADRVSGLVFVGRDMTWRVNAAADHFNWGNEVVGASWRHLFGGRAVLEQRLSVSRFTEKLDSGYSRLQDAKVQTDHRLQLATAQGQFWLELPPRQQIEAGYSVSRSTGQHLIAYASGLPATVREQRSSSYVTTRGALYVQDEIPLMDALRLRIGLRAESGQQQHSFQPRVSAKYLLSDAVSLTAGAGWLRQYTHLLQDSDIAFDIYTADIWLASTEPAIPVARASHLVGGVEARVPHGLQFRAEAYEKSFDGLVTLAPFDPSEKRFATQRLENASGEARGLDLSLGRDSPGRVRGWIGYSLAASTRTVGDSSFAAEPHPRQRLVAVWEADPRPKLAVTGRFEVSEGVPFTPAVAMLPERSFDLGLGRFSDQCSATDVEYLYGIRNSARTGWSKRLDLGAGRRWSDRRGRKWELSFSLLNVLFDPTGIFRPAPAGRESGCDAPAEVVREHELILPPIPSVGVRVEF